jgi:hypothetical protein
MRFGLAPRTGTVLPSTGWETALIFLLGTACSWWGGAAIAYLFAGLIGFCAISYSLANGLHGTAPYVRLLSIALFVAGYLRDHPQRPT